MASVEKNKEFILDNNNAITLINFYKIFKDLIIDLNNSFRDKIGTIITNNKDYQNIITCILPDYKETMNADEYVSSIELSTLNKEFMESLNTVYEYCKKTFATRSIDILYQNEEMFLEKTYCTMFLPDIEFSELYYDDTSEKTKQTIWKYLQLVLFNIITSINDISFFGDSLELLKIIDSDKFSSKIQGTIDEISKMFSKTNETNETSETNESTDNESYDTIPDIAKLFDMSSNPFKNMFKDLDKEDSSSNNTYNGPDKEEVFSHINKLLNGKIGSLAKEIAEETTKDLDLDVENITDVNDVLKGFMKNPTKLLGLINNISSKINSKMKDGSLKESELLEEATNIFKDMKNMPGMNNIQDIFKSMNLDQFMPKGGKINPNAFQNMMEQNLKMSKMKERMKKKAETNKECNKDSKKEKSNSSKDDIKLDDLTANLSTLMEQMQNNTSFIDDIIKKQQGNGENTPRKSINKKKANKKK